jgi:hypothetical protein
MIVSQWLDEFRRACEESDWDALEKLRHGTNQSFAERTDYRGIKRFYDEALRLGLDDDKLDAVRIVDTESFQSGLSRAFSVAKSKLDQLSGIKGVYFEYFYDGGDSCTGNVYLCNAFSDEDDGWGAEFDQGGFIEGPSIIEYFNFDLDFEWDELPRVLAEEYVNGTLFSATLEEWTRCEIRGLPFGFANHEHEIVRVPAS